jgi:hypothetical protein
MPTHGSPLSTATLQNLRPLLFRVLLRDTIAALPPNHSHRKPHTLGAYVPQA